MLRNLPLEQRAKLSDEMRRLHNLDMSGEVVRLRGSTGANTAEANSLAKYWPKGSLNTTRKIVAYMF